MCLRIVSRTLGLLSLLAAITTSSLAQGRCEFHYKLVDLGTFGGPDSIIPFIQRVLTDNGILIGNAETAVADPFDPQCSTPNCKIQNGFEWRHGIKVKLSGLTRGGSTDAEAVNQNGTIAGGSWDGTVDPVSWTPLNKAVIWKNLQILKLGTLGGRSSGSISINGNDQVTGWSETADGTETHAFLWTRGTMRDIGTLGGPLSFGQDVNDRGQVVGFSFLSSDINPATGQPTQHPFFWDHGHMIDIGLGGSLGGSGFLNNRGQAIGDSLTPGDTEDHAFLWSEGKVHDLGTLGGSRSLPTGLTDAAHISGVSWLPGDQGIHAVLWTGTTIRDLGAVDDDGCSWAWALNSRDQVVGISVPSCDLSRARAFLWDKGTMVDLNELVPPDSTLHLVYAMAINDAGEIAGIGVPPGISPGDVETLGHAFILIPQESNFSTVNFTVERSVQRLQTESLPNLKAATEELTSHLRRMMAPRDFIAH